MSDTVRISQEWVFVEGGTCQYGDRLKLRPVRALWWRRTPVITAEFCRISGMRGFVPAEKDLPVVEINFYEALDIVQALNARLPTSVEWEWMAAGRELRQYPWGNEPWTNHRANLRDSGIRERLPVGQYQSGKTPEGLLDVAGNVWEWTSTPVQGEGAIVRGGSFNSDAIAARCKFINAAPKELRSKGIGIRPVREAAVDK